MNKLTNTGLFLFMSVMALAQRQREGRFPANDGPEDQFAGTGGNPTPVDQYMYLLIAVAVVMIAYVIYRRIQLNKAV